RLFRAPSRQARHHRLGADQRLAGRDRHPREDPASGRVRPLLHRELVGAVRSVHSRENADRACHDRERVLMRHVEKPGKKPRYLRRKGGAIAYEQAVPQTEAVKRHYAGGSCRGGFKTRPRSAFTLCEVDPSLAVRASIAQLMTAILSQRACGTRAGLKPAPSASVSSSGQYGGSPYHVKSRAEEHTSELQ